VRGDGLDDAEAEVLGARLLETGQVDLPRFEALVAPIVSARRTYGSLATFLPARAGFLPVEQEHLEAYAGLAAAALDVGVSLQEARRSGEISAALLGLGRQLAHESDAMSVAQRVAEAVPMVTAAARASVLLWDATAGRLSQAAAVGFGDQLAEALAIEITRESTPLLGQIMERPIARRYDAEVGGSGGDPFIDRLLARYGDRSISIAPIVASGEFLGVLVASHPGAASVSLPADPSVDADEPDLPTQALADLADQAGIAIARLRLLDAARHAASHDHLTGLAGRALFHDRVERALLDGDRHARATAVCFLDLDGFKLVNDTFGHAAGDALLVEIADRIRRTVRATDTVSRIAGDEFAVLLRDLDDPAAATHIAESLVSAISVPHHFEGHRLAVGVSIGVAFAPDHGMTTLALLQAADAAMYGAKRDLGGWRSAGVASVAR
jgi:diguanylate cyclase (GGDEF)-like protein